jgi:hypothetical protein
MEKIKIYSFLLFVLCVNALMAQEQNNMLEIFVCKVDNDSVFFYISNTTSSDTLYFSIFKQEVINEKYTTTSSFDIFSKDMHHGMLIYKIYPKEYVTFHARPELVVYGSDEDEKWDEPVIVETEKCRFLLKATVNSCKKKIYKFYSNYLE